jgi:hypothetical protein
MSTTIKPLSTPGLTAGYADPELVRQIGKSVPGMAHFAATGPFGTHCKDCHYFGAYQQVKNKAGDVVRTPFRSERCAAFLHMTGKLGPAVPPQTESCRHFRYRDEK